MTEALSHPHATASQPYFPEAEWQQLQADDRHGAAVVLGLMTSIFTIGLILYSVVLYFVLE
jgi:hypothetical protein